MNVNYASQTVLTEYVCGKCHRSGIKLWREYETFDPGLLCADCAANDQHKDIRRMIPTGRYQIDGWEWTDQIGWYVPAVPDEEGVGYWDYTSVPDAGVQWWKRLPNR